MPLASAVALACLAVLAPPSTSSSTSPSSSPSSSPTQPAPPTQPTPKHRTNVRPARVSDAVLELTAQEAIRRIRREHFGAVRSAERRAEGIKKLSEFRSLDAMQVMYEELRRENVDVINGMFDHFATRGADGLAAFTWIAIHDGSEKLRAAARARIPRVERPLDRPPSTPKAIANVITSALFSSDTVAANRAGSLAGGIGAIDLIPSLINAQSAESERTDQQGDLGWIAIQTQKSYVANLIPVVGDNSGAFQPVIGVIGEGSLLRVMDAVVITYRTEVHYALVDMTSAEWGRSTQQFAYDRRAWADWYNHEYRPLLEERDAEYARIARAKEIERAAQSEAID